MATLAARTVEEIYEQHIKPLSREDRLRLLAITDGELAGEANSTYWAKMSVRASTPRST